MTEHVPTTFVKADANGRILLFGTVPKHMLAIQPLAEGEQLVEGAGHWDTDYVKDGVVVPRPDNPATLDGMKISNVPNPSAVTIGTESPVDVQDGEVDLEFAYPGTYTVTVVSWPYQDATFTVTQQ
jgi:hypothetical protein